jgi:hypothetical protein
MMKKSKFQIDPMMNKQLSIIGALVLGMLCWAGLVQAQFNHPYNTGGQTVVTVPSVGSVLYYDSGGSGGNYLANHNNANTTIRFQPTTAGAKVQATFTAFNVEGSFDALYVWDGQNTAAPKIASGNGAPITNNFWGTGGWWGTGAPNNAAPNVARATGATGNLTFGFVCDGSVQLSGWAATMSEFIPCNPIPNPASLNIGLNPGVCVASANLNFPTFSPAGCGNQPNYAVYYRLDANPFVAVNQPYPSTVTINDIPSGTHTVTWEVRIGTGAAVGTAVQTINVNDTEPPTLNCPSNQIINLDPGLCCAIVSWADPTATDNCPFIGPVQQLQQTCTYTNYWAGYALDLVNKTTGPMLISAVQIQAGLAGAGAGNKNLRVYMRTGSQAGNTGSSAGWTEVANTSINVTAGFPTNLYFNIPFNLTYTIAANGTSGIYVVVDNGSNSTRVVANVFNTTPTEDANLRINQNPSTWVNGVFGGPAFNENPRPWLRVDYQLGGDAKVTQIDGKTSGSDFCKGETDTITYETFDVAGNRSECSFTVTVNEFANPISNLICNDNVQISLGENCTTVVGADDVLEGGPYGCYDDYMVTIFNAQNQPLASSPSVGAAQIGQTWKVQVKDPETGNYCWGSILVEDKWKPTMVCQNLEVACGENIPVAPAPEFFSAQAPVQYPASFLNHGGGTAYTLQGNTLAGGVYFNVTNNSTDELRITGFGVRFGNPQFGQVNPPQTMQVYTKPGTYAGFETNAAAWTNMGPQVVTAIPPYFATGTGPLAQVPVATAQVILPGETRAFHIWGATACPVFNYFNGTAPVTNGPFTVAGGPISFGLLSNLFQAGASSMPNIQVNYLKALPEVLVTDNCTPTSEMNNVFGNAFPAGQAPFQGGLIYGDDIDDFTCAQNANVSQRITRVWTARDRWGNTTQCVQLIDVKRPTVASLELPLDYNDLPGDGNTASLDCKGSYPTPDVTGFPGGGGCGSLQFDYMDKVLNVCQGSYTIIRSWTINDMCTGDIAKHDQTIMVKDKTAPVVFCPVAHDIKVGLTTKSQKGCTANVMLPWIQVTDDCSTTNNLTVYTWTTLPDGTVVIVDNMNAQGFYVFDLPVQPAPHQYTFVYTAIDDCGNKAECTVDVAVRDQTPPVVICEEFHVVALTDSVTFVNATSFDDGSYDDCSMVTFAARRGTMNAAGAFTQHPCNQPGDFLYNTQVRFYCCDAQSTTDLFVDLRVRDAYGNDNFCMVPVTVVDKVRPVIWCPENITVQCGMPYVPTGIDTFVTTITPNVAIKNAYANVYPVTIDIFGIPADAKITDLDLGLNIDHEVVNQLQITLYSPLNRKATVLPVNGCAGQPVQFPWGIDVTFNDQAYDIAVFNSTGQKVPAAFTCTSAKPSIGAYNQGQMKPKGDELKIFNGQPLNSFTNKNLCFTVGANDINVATNRMSNFQVQQFIANAGLIPGDRILLEYASATGGALTGATTGNVYLFQVINNNTIEFLTITGSDISAVASGSTHMFCASGTWLLVVEDTAPLGGGNINEVTLSIGYVLPTGLRPVATDNTEECGLTITHQDLGQPDECPDNEFINRRWSVADAFGNNTNCIQRVYFNDATPLTVQFPCDVTVVCADPSATGEVKHNADCELPGVEFTDHQLVTTDGCYKILRTWVVKDWCKYQADGNVDYPTTTINDATEEITFTTAINPLLTSRKIEVGDRVTLRYVTSGTTEIPGLIEGDVYSMVRVSGTTFRVEYNTTKQQTVNITGAGTGPHIFRYANSDLGLPLTCDVLLEWYPFVDWYTACCNPATERRQWEDDGDGYFKFVQEIKVVDKDKPTFVDCTDAEYCSFEANCGPTAITLLGEATDNCTPADQLQYTYTIDAFNDGTFDINGVGSDASGSYPLGTHKIVWKVTDQCGNWNTCTKLFTIKDCKKPTPICINGLSVDLMPATGMAEVQAVTLESGGSYDNCTDYGKLTILVERKSDVGASQTAPDTDAGASVIVNCDDFNTNGGVLEVVVWVGDEAGNWDYCVTTLLVQDNMGACGSGSAAALTSYTSNEQGEAVEQVNVELTGASTQQQVTGTGGTASFGGLTVGQSVTVAPNKDMNPLNGVSTYDLLLMQKHLLGIKALNSPYKLIAADVNNSANISISDIIELRKMILTPGLNFKDNTSWRFVEAGYVFPNPAKPYGFPETKSFQALGANNAANFTAVKVGDVSGDHTPNSLLGSETRNSVGTLSFSIAEQTLVAGQQYTVAVRAEHFRGVQGYQYTMDFNTEVVEFVGVDAVWGDLSESNFGRAKAAEGILTTSWNGSEGVTLADGEVLYTVTFRAKANAKLSQALKVNSRVTKAEAYDASEELLDVQFRFDGGVVTGGEFALYQNEPNPFRDVTVIGFNLPAATKATLKVFDVTGKVVKVVTGDFAKGYNMISLNRVDVQGNGMLYYQLDTDTDSATKRMILVD